ncbi:protein FAM71B-like [Hyaena hyaena]|uniref:protein FAM71B-like n=1 Tax=Hyaena hyaena TaxID=95912 RepID=UPI001922A338|nr:protein FAM71B-like [Hyaena hyaena]
MLSSFFQQLINKRGEVIDVHNSLQMVTVGTAYTSHNLTISGIMLLAQPAVSCAVRARNDQDTRGKGHRSIKSLELTRLSQKLRSSWSKTMSGERERQRDS